MKKLISLLITIAMVLALFAGCSGPAKSGADDDGRETASAEESKAAEEVSEEVSAEAPETSEAVSTGNPVADSYTAYSNAKYVLIDKLTAALEQDPNALSAYMTIAGVSLADISLAPIAVMGADAATVEASMAYLGIADVDYTINGNRYTMTYTDTSGQTLVYDANYDPASDSMVMTVTVNGAQSIFSEYHKTSFGYVSQSYFDNNDGTGMLYQFSISGEDGVFGYSSTTAAPAGLTGSEPAEFPQGCSEWYAVKGYTITGMTSDGTAVNFEYTPEPSES